MVKKRSKRAEKRLKTSLELEGHLLQKMTNWLKMCAKKIHCCSLRMRTTRPNSHSTCLFGGFEKPENFNPLSRTGEMDKAVIHYPPWQCASTISFKSEWILSKNFNISVSTPFLRTKSGTKWLFLGSKCEEMYKGQLLWHSKVCKKSNNRCTKVH